MMISFAQPLWLLAGLITTLVLWLLWSRFESGRTALLQKFAAAPLLAGLTTNVSTRRRLTKKLLILGAVFVCFVALARPQYGYRWIDVKHKGIDILFGLDTSKSMMVEDIRPNRLERSKLAIMDFVSQLSGDRVGLMPFAGASYLICPLTADYFAFEQSLAAIDTTIIPTGGTNIGQAIDSAEKILSNEANHKILVLITDGENLQGDALGVAHQAQKQNMTIYTVGVGTGEGELIPDSEGGFIKDSTGSYVKSRLDEQGLTAIAEATDAFYVPLGHQGQGLETIYQQKLALIPKTELAEKRKKIPIDRFEWPVGIAILLMVIEYLLSARKNGNHLPHLLSRLKRRNSTHALHLFLVIGSIFLYPALPVSASEGEISYDAGNFLKAAEHYQVLLEKDPENQQLHYNSGTVAYKNNLLDEAAEYFEKSLLTDNVALQEKSYYNLGNVRFRTGEETLNNDQQETIKQWEQSLVSYEGVLAINPQNEDARYNHELVKQRLDQLKQQQQSQPPKQQENDKNSEEQEKDEGDQDQQSPSDQQKEEEKQDSETGSPETEQNNQEEQDKTSPEKEQTTGPEEKSPGETSGEKEHETPDTRHEAGDQSPDQQSASSPEQEGKAQAMTPEEAEQLLQAVQAEEGRLNLYVPTEQRNNQKIKKDW